MSTVLAALAVGLLYAGTTWWVGTRMLRAVEVLQAAVDLHRASTDVRLEALEARLFDNDETVPCGRRRKTEAASDQ